MGTIATYLPDELHGHYDRHLKASRKAVRFLTTATDQRRKPFALIHGVALDLWHESRIVAVRGCEDALHAEFTLMSGERVVTWEPKMIEELWKVGLPVTVHAAMTQDVRERMELKDAHHCLGWPALYELPTSTS